MEVITALGVPEGAPFLTVITLVSRSCAATIRVRFVAEGAIVTELISAFLPADWAYAIITISAQRIAKCTILLFVVRARRDRFADSAAVSLDPACIVAVHELLLREC